MAFPSKHLPESGCLPAGTASGNRVSAQSTHARPNLAAVAELVLCTELSDSGRGGSSTAARSLHVISYRLAFWLHDSWDKARAAENDLEPLLAEATAQFC